MNSVRAFFLAGAVGAFIVLPQAGAATPDDLIPGDSAFVLTVNVKQILESPLVKKRGVAAAKEMLKNVDVVNEIFNDLGFDPFTDLDRVTIAAPSSSDKDRALVVVRGHFDVDKFKARAEKAAKDDAEFFKIGKGGGKTIYQVNLPDQDKPLFVALLNKTTLIASPGKDYILDAIKKSDGKAKQEFKDKNFEAVLSRLNPAQSLAFALVAAALKGEDLGPAADLLQKVDAAGGGLAVADDLKLEIILSTKTAGDADKLKSMVNDGINAGIGFLGLSVGNNSKFEQVLDVLKSIKATSKDKTVTLKVRIDAEMLEKLGEMSGK